MPKLFGSFTGTLRSMQNGSVTEADLDEGYFMFGCARGHAVEPWKDSTNELTWFWKNDPEEGLRQHAVLVNAIFQAEMAGRVAWRDEAAVEQRLVAMRFADAVEALVK